MSCHVYSRILIEKTTHKFLVLFTHLLYLILFCLWIIFLAYAVATNESSLPSVVHKSQIFPWVNEPYILLKEFYRSMNQLTRSFTPYFVGDITVVHSIDSWLEKQSQSKCGGIRDTCTYQRKIGRRFKGTCLCSRWISWWE